jgi:hypothetical protein
MTYLRLLGFPQFSGACFGFAKIRPAQTQGCRCSFRFENSPCYFDDVDFPYRDIRMAFSEIKLSHPSREQTQISGLNPNVAMVMCQSFEGMKVWAFSPVGSSP